MGFRVMVKKVVNLTVHKNTLEKRAKRQLGSTFRKEIEKVFKDRDIRMYTFVGIDADGKAWSSWDTGGIIPLWAVPATVMDILRTDVAGYEDDWKPPPMRPAHRNIEESK